MNIHNLIFDVAYITYWESSASFFIFYIAYPKR